MQTEMECQILKTIVQIRQGQQQTDDVQSFHEIMMEMVYQMMKMLVRIRLEPLQIADVLIELIHLMIQEN
jgi:CxxC motif-containing protein